MLSIEAQYGKLSCQKHMIQVVEVTKLTTRKCKERRKPAGEENMAATCKGSVL
jgi:hypothetical protein